MERWLERWQLWLGDKMLSASSTLSVISSLEFHCGVELSCGTGNHWLQNTYFIGPILWGHSGPLCHALSLLLLWTSILHCHSSGVAAVACRLRYSWLWLILVVVLTVATPGEWQCKIRTGGVRLLAVANGPNICKCFLFTELSTKMSV